MAGWQFACFEYQKVKQEDSYFDFSMAGPSVRGEH